MKYIRADAEVINFNGMDIFAYTSEQTTAINNGITSLGCSADVFGGVGADGKFDCSKFENVSSGTTIPGTYGFVVHWAGTTWQVNGI